MKNKILYGVLILFLIISDIVYLNIFISGGYITSDTGGIEGLSIPILFLVNLIAFVIGLTKINKQKLFSFILIILSLPTLISAVWMRTHSKDFDPRINKATMSQVSNLKALADLYYSDNESYIDICSSSNNGFGGEGGLIKAILDTSENKELKCFSDKDSWVVSVKLIKPVEENTYVCSDSSNSERYSKLISTIKNSKIVNADTLCLQK